MRVLCWKANVHRPALGNTDSYHDQRSPVWHRKTEGLWQVRLPRRRWLVVAQLHRRHPRQIYHRRDPELPSRCHHRWSHGSLSKLRNWTVGYAIPHGRSERRGSGEAGRPVLQVWAGIDGVLYQQHLGPRRSAKGYRCEGEHGSPRRSARTPPIAQPMPCRPPERLACKAQWGLGWG